MMAEVLLLEIEYTISVFLSMLEHSTNSGFFRTSSAFDVVGLVSLDVVPFDQISQ